MRVAGIRIPVQRSADGYFARGNIPVTAGNNRFHRYAILPLSDETLKALGYEWCWDLRLRKCRICHGLFIAHYSAILCSEQCAQINQQAWHKAHRRPSSPPSKAAERRAAIAEATCQECGTPIQAKRLTARFCSGRCRQKHHRKAH
jgi:endogenous inhibitor of DNA gyrase (YacG/DUF329 family)